MTPTARRKRVWTAEERRAVGLAAKKRIQNMTPIEREAFHSAGGRAGGPARARKMTAQQRVEISKRGGKASKLQWLNLTPEERKERLAKRKATLKRGVELMGGRLSPTPGGTLLPGLAEVQTPSLLYNPMSSKHSTKNERGGQI